MTRRDNSSTSGDLQRSSRAGKAGAAAGKVTTHKTGSSGPTSTLRSCSARSSVTLASRAVSQTSKTMQRVVLALVPHMRFVAYSSSQSDQTLTQTSIVLALIATVHCSIGLAQWQDTEL